jgi:hypothetical protein
VVQFHRQDAGHEGDPAAGGLEPARVTVDEIIACLGTRPHPEDQLGAPCSVQTTLLTVLLTARQASWSRTSNAIIRPDTSYNIESWDGRGRVLRASFSLVVIGFAASINAAAAQYLSHNHRRWVTHHPRTIPTGATHHRRTMAIGVSHRQRTIGPILQRRFKARIRTQTMNMTGLTPHNQGLALRQVASDRSR